MKHMKSIQMVQKTVSGARNHKVALSATSRQLKNQPAVNLNSRNYMIYATVRHGKGFCWCSKTKKAERSSHINALTTYGLNCYCHFNK